MSEAVKAFCDHSKEVLSWLAQIWEEEQLDLFFVDYYLYMHRDNLIGFMEHCANKLAISIHVDRETLKYLHTVPASTLCRQLGSCINDPVFLKRKPVYPHMALELRVLEKDGELCWTINEAESGLYKHGTLNQSSTMDAMKTFINRYEATVVETHELVARFIASSPALTEYYKETHFKQRCGDICQWLRSRFVVDSLIITIDGESDFLLKQLFTSLLSVDKTLSYFVDHRWFDADFKNPSFLKKEIKLGCEEMLLNSPILRKLANDKEIFSTPSEYTDLARKYYEYPALKIDMGQAWYEDKVRCITLFIKPEYATIQSNYEARQMLTSTIKQLQEDRQRKLCVDQQNKNDSVLAKQMVDRTIAEMPERLSYKSDFVVTEGFKSNVADLMIKSTTALGGLQQSFNVFKGCVDETVSGANDAFEQRGMDYFRGDIMLSTTVMNLDGFDKKQKNTWSKPVKKLMADENSRLRVKEYKDSNLRVNTMSLTYGEEEVSRCVIPCIMSHNHYSITTNNNNNNIVLNFGPGTNNGRYPTGALEEEEGSKKRKRAPKVSWEKISRIRLINEHEENDDDEPDILYPLYKMTAIAITNPDLNAMARCIVCAQTRFNTQFFQPKGKSKTLGYMRNICHTCVGRRRRYLKLPDESKEIIKG